MKSKRTRSAAANAKMVATRKKNKAAKIATEHAAKVSEQYIPNFLKKKKFTKKPRRVSLIQIDDHTYLLRIKD